MRNMLPKVTIVILFHNITIIFQLIFPATNPTKFVHVFLCNLFANAIEAITVVAFITHVFLYSSTDVKTSLPSLWLLSSELKLVTWRILLYQNLLSIEPTNSLLLMGLYNVKRIGRTR